MPQMKFVLQRLALTTAALTIIAALGALLGGMTGAVLELMLQALAGIALSPMEVVPLFAALGLVMSLIWGVSVLVQHWPEIPAAQKV